VDHAHEVFDKSGLVVDVVEKEVSNIMDTTLQEVDEYCILLYFNRNLNIFIIPK